MKLLFRTNNREDIPSESFTQAGLFKEVAKLEECLFCGPGWSSFRKDETLSGAVKRLMPSADAAFDYHEKPWERMDPNRTYLAGTFWSDLHGKIHWGVKTPEELLERLNEADYDLFLMRSSELYGSTVPPDYFLKGLRMRHLFFPWSADPDWYKPAEDKDLDLCFIGSYGKPYPIRTDLVDKLPTFCKAHSLKLYIGQTPYISGWQRHEYPEGSPVGKVYADILGRSRIMMFDSSIYRYPVQKYFEALASGCLVMADEPAYADRLGLVDGVNYVKISREDWRDKLWFYTKDKEKASKVAERGRQLFLERHTHRRRAKELIDILKRITG